jgi:alkanesulfonate monooxygenase SsuD/methylene tetrahydromethanopterin reductase-like flavin-dependent oxidoreductase (luciferase family)
VSNGRFLFGFGGGWNAEELANHGVEIKDRFQVTRERILAMKEFGPKKQPSITASSLTSTRCGVGRSQFRQADH